MRTTLRDYVDIGAYPLDRPEAPEWSAAAADVARNLERTGCAVLREFIRPETLNRLRREADQLAPRAHYETATVNVFNTAVDRTSDLPDDHPARVELERGNAFVARDQIPDTYILQHLYRDPVLHQFLAACLGLSTLYELGDPLSGLCLNVIPPGRTHPWHFDTNEVAISLLVRGAQNGGVFEYCPGIRSADRENLEEVSAVLAGQRHLVHTLDLQPGDLQIFRGRYSLHRVTPVAGSHARHSAIFAYSARPGVTGTEERTRQLFGRTLPEHHDPHSRVDALLI